MIKNILYTTDFSEAAENGLPHALTLSLLFDAKLILFHAQILHQDDPSNPLYHLPQKEELCKKAEEISKNMLDKRTSEMKDIKFETLTRRDLFADRAILSLAEEKGVDLIVMGTHGRRGITKLLIGSTTLNVLKFSKIPVYVVPPYVKAPSKEDPFKELLVCLDFSCASLEALELAKEFKEKTGAKLHLIHILEGKEREAKKKMEEIEKDSKTDKKMVIKGKAEKEILKYAREEAIDLIFLGNKSEKEDLFALGSKVERIILNSPSPCVVTKL